MFQKGLRKITKWLNEVVKEEYGGNYSASIQRLEIANERDIGITFSYVLWNGEDTRRLSDDIFIPTGMLSHQRFFGYMTATMVAEELTEQDNG